MLKKIFLFLIIFFIGIISGSILFSKSQITPTTSTTVKVNENSPIRQNNPKYIYTNPLLECDVANSGDILYVEDIKKQLNMYIQSSLDSKNTTQVSMYYRDLNNGPWLGINEKEDFTPASLLKVPVMMAYLKEADKNPEILTKKITYTGEDDTTNQNIKPQVSLIKGQLYTVDELIKHMILYSDNTAGQLLFANIDESIINNTYNDLGINIPDVRKQDDYMSVKNYASFFRIMYNSSYLSRDMSEKALAYLKDSDYKDGLVAGIPKEIVIAHKFGERILPDLKTKQLHDCGIVYYPKNPYLICIMTRGQDFTKLSTAIKDLSSIVWKTISNKKLSLVSIK